MNKKTNRYILIATIAIVVMLFGSCYYDNMEDLYATRTPPVAVCDSVNVSYTNTISVKFADNNCYSCHGNAGPNFNFQDYTTFKNYVIVTANKIKLLDSINAGHNYASYSLCEKSQLTNWITIGAPQ